MNLSILKEILSLIGEELVDASFLASGATSEVWLLTTSQNQSYVFKKIFAPDRAIDGDVDQELRHLVHDLGGQVIVPVINSSSVGNTFGLGRWSLEKYVAGVHPKRGELDKRCCQQLGQTLAVLHGLPVRNFGRLNAASEGCFIGELLSPIEGVSQRFDNPLPKIWGSEFQHPILLSDPPLGPEIIPRLELVSNVVAQGHAVVCHADLHEKQVLCRSGELAALLDFGDATILDRHWDLGSFLYFNGISQSRELCSAYCAHSDGVEIDFDVICSFSIAIAMHHASRSRLPGKVHRFAYANEHIRTVLSCCE